MSKRMVHNAKDHLMPITKLPLERIILYLWNREIHTEINTYI